MSVTMSNPTNQLPSYKIDTIVQANIIYYYLLMGNASKEIKHNKVVVKKENRGEEGSK